MLQQAFDSFLVRLSKWQDQRVEADADDGDESEEAEQP
jgi:hypothetical protein